MERRRSVMTLATVSVTDLRREVGRLLRRAKEEPVIITKQGRPQVVILDYVEYRKLKERLTELEGQVRSEEMLAPSPSQSKIKTLIKELQGKYAGYPSLTEALLTERARERAREAENLRSR